MILMLLTVICAFGWFISHINMLAIIHYIISSGQRPPSKEEVSASTEAVVRHIFKRDRSGL